MRVRLNEAYFRCKRVAERSVGRVVFLYQSINPGVDPKFRCITSNQKKIESTRCYWYPLTGNSSKFEIELQQSEMRTQQAKGSKTKVRKSALPRDERDQSILLNLAQSCCLAVIQNWGKIIKNAFRDGC